MIRLSTVTDTEKAPAFLGGAERRGRLVPKIISFCHHFILRILYLSLNAFWKFSQSYNFVGVMYTAHSTLYRFLIHWMTTTTTSSITTFTRTSTFARLKVDIKYL